MAWSGGSTGYDPPYYDPYHGHNSFAYWAAKSIGLPEFSAENAATRASEPDFWEPTIIDPFNQIVHCISHYYNPYSFGGQAPYYSKEFAKDAYDAFQTCNQGSCSYSQWLLVGEQFGYATHFLTDVGNPLHTGLEVDQINDKISSETGATPHTQYEENVTENWVDSYDDLVKSEHYHYPISSPSQATKNLATFSHIYLDTLYYRVQNQPSFNSDETVQLITENCIHASARYARGLAIYCKFGATANRPAADFKYEDLGDDENTPQIRYTDTSNLISPVSSRSWTFIGGSPSSSDDSVVTVTYNSRGMKHVSLYIESGNYNDSKTMDVPVGVEPHAAFEYTPNGRLTIQFYDKSTVDSDCYPITREWNFGDEGSPISTIKNPIHTYAYSSINPGTLRIKTLCGNSEFLMPVIVFDPINVDFLTEISGRVLQIYDTSSVESESYKWSFGDNSPISNVRNPTHEYASIGTYTIQLTAKDPYYHDEYILEKQVSISDDSLSASLTSTPRAGTAPLTVRFTDTSTGNPAGWGWTFGDNSTINSTMQNPVHTYTANGTYSVSLWVTGAGGTNTTTRVNSICVGDCRDKVGIYRDGAWYLDNNGNGIYGAGDRNFAFGGAGWTPVIGDWASDGKSKGGVYKDGNWYLDYNGNGIWDAGDRNYGFGGVNWTAVTGDWNGAGSDKIGAYKDGAWYLDYDGSGTWTASDKNFAFGGAGWTPVVGKWTSDGKSKVGVYKDGVYYIDYSGDWVFGAGDKTVSYGTTGSTAVIGDWNANGLTEVGTQTGNQWKLDYDGSGAINASTKSYTFGAAGWNPVIGDWNGDGKDKIGIYQDGAWYLDYSGNGVWEGGSDKNYAFGSPGWLPLIGFW